jgi:hypothetical protein
MTKVLASLMLAGALAPQGRFTNVRSETRSAAQGLEREVRAAAARGGIVWIGYRAPMVAWPRRMCCSDTVTGSGDSSLCCGICRLDGGSGVTLSTAEYASRIVLESPTEFLVLARFENGAITRLRTFTPDCDVDAGSMTLIWMTDVKPEESIAWLSTLATSTAAASDTGQARERVAKQAVTAIALHNVPAADRALEAFVAPVQPEWLRSDAAFWLGSSRAEPGARLLARMVQQDPSDRVRDKAVFALSISNAPSALPTLIAVAKEDKSTRVRGQALFWLAHKAGKEAVATITEAIDRDPETEVKKKAVFALSQLPKDEGVPRLIDVARNNRNPEVRKQAFFWLGQSKDPRAVQFFEDILLKK